MSNNYNSDESTYYKIDDDTNIKSAELITDRFQKMCALLYSKDNLLIFTGMYMKNCYCHIHSIIINVITTIIISINIIITIIITINIISLSS